MAGGSAVLLLTAAGCDSCADAKGPALLRAYSEASTSSSITSSSGGGLDGDGPPQDSLLLDPHGDVRTIEVRVVVQGVGSPWADATHFALLRKLREAARAGGGGGGSSGGARAGDGGAVHGPSWLEAPWDFDTALRVAVEASISVGGSLPAVPPQLLDVWVQGLRGAVEAGEAGRRELARSLPPALVGAAAVVGYGALRLCGNPGCGTFAGAAEADLTLKQCAGCKAVWYCGADCQWAHWRQGHRAECRALQGRGQEQVGGGGEETKDKR